MMGFLLEPTRSHTPFRRDLLHSVRDESIDEFRKRGRWDPEDDVSVVQSGGSLFSGI